MITRYLQVLAVAYWHFMMLYSGTFFTILSIYITIYTRYRWIMILYFIWMYIDHDTKDKGGRSIKWFHDSIIWKYFKDYFPHTLKAADGVELDPSKNYLFCYYPHGILAAGTLTSFLKTDLFTTHKICIMTLNNNFYAPITRDLLLAHRGCSSSAKSINYVLSKKGGGNIAVLAIGGAAESEYSKPGQYILYYEKRKGFIKIALKSGAALVPVFSFGEVDLYDQLDYSPLMRRIQAKFKNIMGYSMLIPYGNGYLPYRKPVVTIVGQPIQIPQIESPTIEDINKVHAIFKQKLIELFEEHKHKYVANPETTNLICKVYAGAV